ncbi:hypothetical protein HG536_0F01860 [Torulaspora globosa]|uniref:Uncharacterized protein n=1 Tax=Torulaspora globosa TaxID=48254 RepID=A0A7G3ZK25_9SACH|nr:uncharacterized protein HG536_0F01860 [Torulaspora globosa]QLL33861.1 hypothetical protein HG536_0F01860 [Torulaspora globosa]
MRPQGTQQALLERQVSDDPTLTAEVDGLKELETFLHLEDKDTVMHSIFDSPGPSSDVIDLLDIADDSPIIRELGQQADLCPNQDRGCHYTATAGTTLDDEGILTSDFENFSSPPTSTRGRKLSFDTPPQRTAQTVVDFDFLQTNQTNTPFSVSSTGALEMDAQRADDDSFFGEIWQEPATQKNNNDNLYCNKPNFKVGKPKWYYHPAPVQSFISSNSMDLNYLFHCEDLQSMNNVMPSLNSAGPNSEAFYDNASREIVERRHQSLPNNRFSRHLPEQVQVHTSKPSTGRPRKEKRIKCLKRDSTVTLEQKLDYFRLVMEDARNNGIPGIFLRDHAASELSLEKQEHCALELVLPNFHLIAKHLDTMISTRKSSFRTIWRVTREQFDNKVCLNFYLSDEVRPVAKDDIEISVFVLIVPGHSTKYLVTSCQYLELVNFVLGKNYNHLINDNLAETTVGSDGKMISTQKHHASRVRSHVKKFLRRHVVKDLRKYTDLDRSDAREFEYRMALHNLVLQCYQKKPFESKVSIALMELENVEKALLKQAEFFTFKKV